MSALAQYIKSFETNVMGYDKNQSVITDILMEKGIDVSFDENTEKLINFIPKETLVVYTPAINKENKILGYFKKKQFDIKKRAEVLGYISENKTTIAIAGAHGKTTTSAMLAFVLENSGLGCSALVGGIIKNYKNNLIINNKNNILVLEADEYDKSFLTLKPTYASVSSTDLDHSEIYSSDNELLNTYKKFINFVHNKGKVLINDNISGLKTNNSMSYGLKNTSDMYAFNIKIKDNKQFFDISIKDKIYKNFSINQKGLFNVENSLVVIYFSMKLGVSENKIKKSLNEFEGTTRRFDIHFNNKKHIVIDDYAHHPNEIKNTIKAIKDTYIDKQIILFFQPHTYTRTKKFLSEFAKELSCVDKLCLLPIYAAREKPIYNISSEDLLKKITIKNKTIVNNKNEVLKNIDLKKPSVFVTMGAGDVNKYLSLIAEKIKNV